MPVIDVPLDKINALLGKELSLDELEEYCLQLGADIDDKRSESVKLEYNPNRPDYSSLSGLARDLKGIIGIETGLPTYSLQKGSITVTAEKSVKEVREFIYCAVIRNVSLDEETIASLMNEQETLHWVVGRDRKKVSIGIHDMRDIRPPFRYFAVQADSHPFVPLGEEREMTPAEICKEHPKGMKYAHLVDEDGFVPYLTDAKGGVLSFPPIINGVLTLVTEKTKDLFIDVTGTNEKAVRTALEIITNSFAELGYTVETVTVEYEEGPTVVTPTFEPTEHTLNIKAANDLVGIKFTRAELEDLLLKARFGFKKDNDKKKITVLVPSYRWDIIHEVDLIEEIAISYGYHRLEPELDTIVSVGKQHPVVKMQNKAREIMVGHGFIEVVSFTLVSRDWHYNSMRTKGKPVELLNPVSKEFNIFRDSLLPSLIRILQKNKPYPLPQKIFDVGDISRIDSKEETKATREIFLSGAVIHPKADFVEIKSTLESILKALGVETYKFESSDHPSFFTGRCAKIMVNGKKVGIFGEIHPEVLTNFELENPVGAFELEIEKLF